ncbi:MAG: phosphopantothenoylcysteine decarboxylase [Propionibacteriaceae bacterium]|jgi:phosphopantothenoylcysteine decarboxylase/phosphopantothenoylcysteine decarboxylase/phosphopantothenate--cysteine ligase|nr:phosphopantothenoylcysteine decarboxylase [Propionibacteriaceae bacterium]
MSRILLGVTGSIAAYKAADLTHHLTKDAHQVDVVMTKAAAEFITPLTLRTLSGRPVYGYDQFADAYDDVRHISMARDADVAVIAPASANIIGKLASGLADDHLTTVFTALRDQPRLIAPAMNTYMYQNPIVQQNLAKLVDYGWELIEPTEALLACGDIGKGALPPIAVIIQRIYENL